MVLRASQVKLCLFPFCAPACSKKVHPDNFPSHVPQKEIRLGTCRADGSCVHSLSPRPL